MREKVKPVLTRATRDRIAESALIVAVTGRRTVRCLRLVDSPEHVRPASYMIFQDVRLAALVDWLDFMEPENDHDFTGAWLMSGKVNSYLLGLIHDGFDPVDDAGIFSIIRAESRVKLTVINPDYRCDVLDRSVLYTRRGNA